MNGKERRFKGGQTPARTPWSLDAGKGQHTVTPAMVVAAKKTFENGPRLAPAGNQTLEASAASIKDQLGRDFPREGFMSGKKSLEENMSSVRKALEKSTAARSSIPAPPSPPPSARQKTPGKPAPPNYGKQEIDAAFAKAIKTQQDGDLDGAISGYKQVLSMDPQRAEAYNYMGEALRAQNKLDAAIACFKRSLAIRQDDPIVLSSLSDALRSAGQLAGALAASQRAMKAAPKSPKAAYVMGLVLRDLGQASSAAACFEKALALKPDMADCRHAHALSLLRIGEYKRGFAEFEWRWKLPGNPPREFAKPVWDGLSLAGKTIFIHHERTLGDMIQFARYVLLVKDKGGEVIVECQPELLRLFFTLPGADRAIAAGDRVPPFDVYAPILSLPRIMGATAKTIPVNVPYLSPPGDLGFRLSASKGTRLKVGIVWGGSAANDYDQFRSCPLKGFLHLMDRPDVAFFSLQKGEAASQIAENSCEALIVNLEENLSDFADTAAAISQLDLVITVDTAVAHLAGALGQPVWVLLPFAAGWRWGSEPAASAWYPSARLFRQSRPKHWDDVIAEVEKALRQLLKETEQSLA